MNQSGLKNVIVLKNLPSNIVEEAIVVFKKNIKIKCDEKIENKINDKEKTTEKNRENDYILKEAEMLISNYITRIEKKKKEKNELKKKMEDKCKKLKKCITIMSLIILFETILIILK